jgi:hypothetical protein
MAETRQLELNGDEFWESNIMGGGRFEAVHLFIEHTVESLQNHFSFTPHSCCRRRIMNVDLSTTLAWGYLESFRKAMGIVNLLKIERGRGSPLAMFNSVPPFVLQCLDY